MSAAILAPMAIAPVNVLANEDVEGDGDFTTSEVQADVRSGGMKIEVKDADFGALEISKTPETISIPDYLRVLDNTGGGGYSVAVRAANYADTEKTLLTTVHLENDVDLTESAAIVQTGESQLDWQGFEGKISGEWGQTPKAGGFTQNLEWTMTAIAKPHEDQSDEFAKIAEDTDIFASGNTRISALEMYKTNDDSIPVAMEPEVDKVTLTKDADEGGVKHYTVDAYAKYQRNDITRAIPDLKKVIMGADLQFDTVEGAKMNELIKSIEPEGDTGTDYGSIIDEMRAQTSGDFVASAADFEKDGVVRGKFVVTFNDDSKAIVDYVGHFTEGVIDGGEDS